MVEIARPRLSLLLESYERLVLIQDMQAILDPVARVSDDPLICEIVSVAERDTGKVLDSIEVLPGETAIVICVATEDAPRLTEAILPLLGELPRD